MTSEPLVALLTPHTFALWLLNFPGNPPSFELEAYSLRCPGDAEVAVLSVTSSEELNPSFGCR